MLKMACDVDDLVIGEALKSGCESLGIPAANGQLTRVLRQRV